MANNCITFSQLVDSKDKVVEGDKVVTSDISDKYLPNILIGYINTINKDNNNLTKSGLVTPAVQWLLRGKVLSFTLEPGHSKVMPWRVYAEKGYRHTLYFNMFYLTVQCVQQPGIRGNHPQPDVHMASY